MIFHFEIEHFHVAMLHRQVGFHAALLSKAPESKQNFKHYKPG
jgi:hypothetical protein